MDTPAQAPKEIIVDKDRFDAILRKIVTSKPLPLKDVTANLRKSKPASD